MEISIIVPVYNVEEYLERCIISIVNQIYRDFELILVDDGSTDNSGNICDVFANRFDWIRVIHKENGGLSDARNTGLLSAKGDYVTFIDSDDIVSSNYLLCHYNALCQNNAEVSCARFEFFSGKCTLVDAPKNIYKKTRVYSGRDACKALLYGKIFQTSSCNILLKKEIALNNPFPIGRYHEDELTTFRYFLSARSVVMTEYITYYYFQRENSIMHSYGKPVFDLLAAADNYPKYFQQYSKDLYNASLCKKYSLYLFTIINYPILEIKRPDIFEKVDNYVRNHSFDILFDCHSPIKTKKMVLKFLLKSFEYWRRKYEK